MANEIKELKGKKKRFEMRLERAKTITNRLIKEKNNDRGC